MQGDAGFAGPRVVQNQVALAERAAGRILTGESDWRAVGEERGERERLGVGPVDRASLAQGRAAAIEPLAELRVEREARRQLVQPLVQADQPLARDRGHDLRRRCRGLQDLGWRRGSGVAGRVVRGLELGQLVAQRLLDLSGRQLAFSRQPLRPEGPNRWVAFDPLVKQRLGEGRLVALIVAPAAVTDQVDQEVFAKDLAVGESQANRDDAGAGIVRVDVHDRDLESLGQIARVERRASRGRWGRETKLVVGDDVDGATDAVSRQPRQIQRFRDDALSEESRVAVDEPDDRP